MVCGALTEGLIAGPTLKGQKTARLCNEKYEHPQWVLQLFVAKPRRFWCRKVGPKTKPDIVLWFR